MSLKPIQVSLLLASAAASAFSLAERIDARSPPRVWQSARACAKDAGPAWYVNITGGGGGCGGGGFGARPGGKGGGGGNEMRDDRR